jgi:hypothetical protein
LLGRVGAPGANIGEKAKAVLVNDLVNGLMEMDPRTWQTQMQNGRQQFGRLSQNIANLQAHLSMIEIPVISYTSPPAEQLSMSHLESSK